MEKGLYAVLLIGMILLISYMAFWVGLTSLLVNRIATVYGRTIALAAFPIIWTAQEKLRELGEMSFPWVMAGYTYGEYTRLIQFLSVSGVYFYTFVIAVSAVLLYLVYGFRKTPRLAMAAAGLLLIIYSSLLFYGDRRIKESATVTGSLKIALIQANIPIAEKWSPDRADSIFTLHCRMTEKASHDSIDLAVWAESALPCYFLRRWGYRNGVINLSDSLNLPILFGSLDYDFGGKNPQEPRYFNSVFYYTPKSRVFLKYDKIKLVPFGEQLPFEGFFPIISRVNLGEADFSRGDSIHLFSLKGHKIFTPICYEVVYPEQMRSFVQIGGELMVQVTNDAWYRRSGMTYQHANICRFRAVETGVPIARCANTGLSCFIDPYGRMDGVTEIFTRVTPIKAVPCLKLDTFFTHHGDIIGWFCLWATLFYFILVLPIYILRKKCGKKD